MPQFSIIIPVYNTEKYLRQCLDSVLAQTFTDYECILVNDGSTDESKKICEEYCFNYQLFKLVNQENQGLSVARNIGISHARGDYIVFLDSDDFINSTALQELHNKISEYGNKNVLISTTYAYFDRENKSKERLWFPGKPILKGSEALWDTFTANDFVVAAWTLTVQRKWLIEHQLFFEPGLLHEDELWYPLTIAAAQEIVVNENAFYYNRCNRIDSIANTPKIKRCFDKLHVVETLSNATTDENCQKAFDYRCGQLMAGIVKDYYDYSLVDSDKRLLTEIKKHLYILWKAENLKYRFLYVICNVLGIDKTSKLIRR